MLTIDVHTHILPESIPDFKKQFGYGGFIKLVPNSTGESQQMQNDDGTFFRSIHKNCWCPHARRQENAGFGVDIQVLSTVPVMFSYWAKPEDTLTVARFLNDHIASIVRDDPQHFVGLATLPMQNPKLAIPELKRCMEELGFAGIQIGTHIGSQFGTKNLNHPEVFKVFEACAALGAAVFVHPWDMMGMERMPDYWLPWLVGMPAETSLAICSMIFGGVFERLPQLRVAFAHGGGSFGGTIGRIEHGFNMRPDLCARDNPFNPRHYLGRFFVDSLVHDEETLLHNIKLYGEDSILLGSDYPFPLGELQPGALIRNHESLSQPTKQKLLGLNALRWLNLSPVEYIRTAHDEPLPL